MGWPGYRSVFPCTDSLASTFQIWPLGKFKPGRGDGGGSKHTVNTEVPYWLPPSVEGLSKNHTPLDELRINGSAASPLRVEGLMFWLTRQKLSGSYLSLRATSRPYF